jgi:4-amino-4-deoxy-L-arabinose transferase-like glycosyltransferase
MRTTARNAPETARGARAGALVVLVASLGFFFMVGTYSLRQPGLQYDEAYDAVPALQVLQGRVPDCAMAFAACGVELPLLLHPHIGATSTYTSLLAFALLGPSVESLRIGQLAVGATALVLLFVLARAWFGDRTAAIAVLLCATAPAFVWWSRGGANWTVPLLPIALGMLIALTRWWRRQSSAALAVASFLFGLGVTTKILFAWLFLPMALSGLLAFGPRALASSLRRLPVRARVLALLALVAGLGPLLAYNLPEPKTLEYVLARSGTTTWGHDNTDLASNLRAVVELFLLMLDGEVSMNAPVDGMVLEGAVFVLAFAYGALRCIVRARPWAAATTASASGGERDFPARLFLVLLFVTVFPQSTFTTSAISATYLFLLVPFVWLLVAAMIDDALGRSRPVRAGPVLGGLLLGALLWSQVSTQIGLLRFFERTGGRGLWSDAIYETSELVSREPAGRPIVALDWGFGRSIELLTDLRLRVVEGHEFLPRPSPRFAERSRALLALPDPIFLVHHASFAMCPGCFAAFTKLARAEGRRLVRTHRVYDREGRVHTDVYEVDATSTSTASQPPPSALFNETRLDDTAVSLRASSVWVTNRLPCAASTSRKSVSPCT